MDKKISATIGDKFRYLGEYALKLLKWLLIGLLVGFVVGVISYVFSWCLEHVTALRNSYPWIVYGLPVGGLVIVGFYKLAEKYYGPDKGTNLIMASISDGKDIPVIMAPLVFMGTVITHLFGGSAGREGAALQLGGSLGNFMGKILKFNERDKKVVIMCGMSAAFSALFGTPMAAAIFAIEASTVGIMYYGSLFPCIVASLVASQFSATMGISPEAFPLSGIPKISVSISAKVMLIALLCGILSIIFCLAMKYVKKYLAVIIKNPFLRVVAVAAVFLGVTFLTGSTDYFGAGIDVIDRAVLEGEAVPYAFILKLVLTALILGGGYKGGEIVPAFYVGATFGCVMGHVLGVSPQLCAAVGMTAMFCGVTNCPITAMLISFELFGFDCVPYILIATAVSFVSSGYTGLYSSQKFIYSKFSLIRKNDK